MKAEERAAQVWSVLALAATSRQILTYDILSKLTGVARQGFAHILDHIQKYCIKNDLPPLTILVVYRDTGLPGQGFTAVQDIPAHQVKVFENPSNRT